MASENITRTSGLVRQYNPLSLQPGALIKADNAVINREHVIENRRGYYNYNTFTGTPPKSLFEYSGSLICHYSTKLAYDDGTGTFTDYSGSYTKPDSYSMRTALTRSNMYFTTNAGVMVIEDLAGSAARLVGAPRALDPEYALTAVASGFLAAGYSTAYRVVIKRTDGNENELTGYPSQRLWAPNATAAAENVTLTIPLPADVVADDVVQVFRADSVSGTSSDGVGDEMKLAFQETVTAAHVTAGEIVAVDSIVDDLLGETLYISPTQQGIGQANERPPLCKDLALYKSSYMFYANTQTRHRLYVTLVGTSALSTKELYIDGVTYTFAGTENTATGTAKAFTGGAAATDIDDTARSLVRVINRYASNTSVYAYYLSGADDLPGKILIEARAVGGSAFSVNCEDTAISAMFFPAPPVTPTTSTKSTSTNEVFANRVYYSKGDEPEHVPLLNYLPVGPSNSEILAIEALRDSMIFVTSAGVYRLTGESPTSFQIVPLDLTVICKARDSVVQLDNLVYFLSNQGVVAVSDAGVQVISRDIEQLITPLLTFANIESTTFGCAYVSERQYILSMATSSTDTASNQSFVYNTFTRNWTRWTYGFSSAIAEEALGRMYFTQASVDNVYSERKSYEDSDYADPESDITITAMDGNVVSFTVSGATPIAGWAIKQGTTVIPSTDMVAAGAGFDATLLYTVPDSWTVGAAEIFPSVGFDIEFNPWHGGDPSLLKFVQEIKILMDPISGNSTTTGIQAVFKTDLESVAETQIIDAASYEWGSAPWGEFAWGGIADNKGYRTWPPSSMHYCRLFSFGVKLLNASQKIAVAGHSYMFRPIGERTSK